jgi:transcriptional regulator of aromatic amino acid metabolism
MAVRINEPLARVRLEKLYIEQNLSAKQVAIRTGYGLSRINELLRKYGISKRKICN